MQQCSSISLPHLGQGVRCLALSVTSSGSIPPAWIFSSPAATTRAPIKGPDVLKVLQKIRARFGSSAAMVGTSTKYVSTRVAGLSQSLTKPRHSVPAKCSLNSHYSSVQPKLGRLFGRSIQSLLWEYFFIFKRSSVVFTSTSTLLFRTTLFFAVRSANCVGSVPP